MRENPHMNVKSNHDLGLEPHLEVCGFYSNSGLFQYFHMSLKPGNSLLSALDYHQGLILQRPAEVFGEMITLVSKVNNLSSSSGAHRYSFAQTNISCFILSTPAETLTSSECKCVYVCFFVFFFLSPEIRSRLCAIGFLSRLQFRLIGLAISN